MFLEIHSCANGLSLITIKKIHVNVHILIYIYIYYIFLNVKIFLQVHKVFFIFFYKFQEFKYHSKLKFSILGATACDIMQPQQTQFCH